MSSERRFRTRRWWIGLKPPYGGLTPWAWFSKSPECPQDHFWGVLPYPLFRDKEEADKAFTENGFDEKEYRVVQVEVTITEIEP